MDNLHGYTPIPPGEVSCTIANLFVELRPPCPCPADMVVITGTTFDGSEARITIKGEEARYYGPVETIERIRAGYCSRHSSLWPPRTP